jgi:rRNA small subunit pseudouridine methyltransferase Nep1
MLTLIIAESALETIPESLWNHPAIKKLSKIRQRPPSQILLDRSYHHTAMKNLENNEKRGRPDIVHFALLEALGSPLNKEKQLATYVHTLSDITIQINNETRLPRNYSRFVSLMEQLFETHRVPPDKTEKPLLTMKQQTFTQLIKEEVKPTHLTALTRTGKPRTLEDTISDIAKTERTCVLIGGFPKGHFTKTVTELADETVCIDSEMLETWTVVSRTVYEFERALSLPQKRLKQARGSS